MQSQASGELGEKERVEPGEGAFSVVCTLFRVIPSVSSVKGRSAQNGVKAKAAAGDRMKKQESDSFWGRSQAFLLKTD